MLCEKCQKTEARVHLIEGVPGSGEMRKHNLCEPCFKERDLSKKLIGKVCYGPTKMFVPNDEPGR